MPKQPAKKPSPKAVRSASAKPTKKSVAGKADRALPTGEDKRTIVHNCIAGCAGHTNFGPNTQLKNIIASAQCVQACVTEKTGQPILISETDTENDIVGML